MFEILKFSAPKVQSAVWLLIPTIFRRAHHPDLNSRWTSRVERHHSIIMLIHVDSRWFTLIPYWVLKKHLIRKRIGLAQLRAQLLLQGFLCLGGELAQMAEIFWFFEDSSQKITRTCLELTQLEVVVPKNGPKNGLSVYRDFCPLFAVDLVELTEGLNSWTKNPNHVTDSMDTKQPLKWRFPMESPTSKLLPNGWSLSGANTAGCGSLKGSPLRKAKQMATCPDSRSGDHRFSSISTIDHPMIAVYSIFDPYLHQPLVSSFFWHMSITCHMAARQHGLSTIAFWLEHLAGWPLKPNESGSSKILGLCGENHGIPQNTPLKCRPVKRENHRIG